MKCNELPIKMLEGDCFSKVYGLTSDALSSPGAGLRK